MPSSEGPEATSVPSLDLGWCKDRDPRQVEEEAVSREGLYPLPLWNSAPQNALCQHQRAAARWSGVWQI